MDWSIWGITGTLIAAGGGLLAMSPAVYIAVGEHVDRAAKIGIAAGFVATATLSVAGVWVSNAMARDADIPIAAKYVATHALDDLVFWTWQAGGAALLCLLINMGLGKIAFMLVTEKAKK
jgi:hypothetical protein